jgi:1-aminocyclopropane-1-carboxylate deaminase
MFKANPVPYQPLALQAGIDLDIKRLDLIHPTISGNKFFKLKYNFLAAQQQQKTTLLSFGGAYSNHLYALAHAAKQYGFASVGIVRGEELGDRPLNPNLACVQNLGMQLQFVSRAEYRLKHQAQYLAQLQQQFPEAYILPEGGSNALAVAGCMEILSTHDRQYYDVICCAVGSGGTLAGLINASSSHQRVLGFAALKGDFLGQQVQQWSHKSNWQIVPEDHFGGYGRFNTSLLQYIAEFERRHAVPLEPIYTGKMLYRLEQMLSRNAFARPCKILVIHSGGLQQYSA